MRYWEGALWACEQLGVGRSCLRAIRKCFVGLRAARSGLRAIRKALCGPASY